MNVFNLQLQTGCFSSSPLFFFPQKNHSFIPYFLCLVPHLWVHLSVCSHFGAFILTTSIHLQDVYPLQNTSVALIYKTCQTHMCFYLNWNRPTQCVPKTIIWVSSDLPTVGIEKNSLVKGIVWHYVVLTPRHTKPTSKGNSCVAYRRMCLDQKVALNTPQRWQQQPTSM